jgi:molecular chaperone DnaJ
MADENHYQILEVSQTANQREIKQAYRRLAKQFHPDSQRETSDREKIIRINAAYEVLSDPQHRRAYDRHLITGSSDETSNQRYTRTVDAQERYQRQRRTERAADDYSQQWLKETYSPIHRRISRIIGSLDPQIEALAADPFDDHLLSAFQTYVVSCRTSLNQARQLFTCQPNPAQLAKVAAHLYYCLNQIDDGIDELERFILNYDDRCLHAGQELFSIARQLCCQAQEAVRNCR